MKKKIHFSDWQIRLRLGSASVMGLFALCYYIYYTLGLFSIETMELIENLAYFAWPVFLLLPAALFIHITLGLWKVYKRNTFRMPLWEISQILMGLSIPFFLYPHIIYTYGLNLIFGIKQDYINELLMTYPSLSWQYTAMTIAIGIHAQIGIHGIMRMRRWYPRVKFPAIFILTIIPLIGLTGYYKAGAEVSYLLRHPETQEEKIKLTNPTPLQYKKFKNSAHFIYLIFPVIYSTVLASRKVRIIIKDKNKSILLKYSGGQSIAVFPKTTILEASRIGKIPHASICGGRARCTTCRVKIDSGDENLSPVGERELKALKRIGAGEHVRLACQSELLKGTVSVTLLLPPEIKPLKARRENQFSVGREMNLVIIFADLRGFTRFSEDKFPYDVVFMLNRYFNFMGEAIENNGGRIDKFLGDGILAFFGLDTDIKTACHQSLKASKEMAVRLIEINNQLKNYLVEPLEIGIGIHTGDVILGEIGYKDNTSLTVIGDTVNTASRLEALNKQAKSQLILSQNVVDTCIIDTSKMKRYNIIIRGKKDPMKIFAVRDIVNELEV